MLLDEIINLAVDNKQPITTLLRKCIVLAHQLKNERLRKWANEELDGYGDIDLGDHRKSGQRLSLQNRPMAGAGTKMLYPADIS